jgi:PAS domain S-box-containing protein
VTAVFAPFHEYLDDTTVAFSFLLVVLFSATLWGSGPALLASVLATLSFNFFFLPPLYTLTIADPRNWVALAAFLLTAVTTGQLSGRAQQRVEAAKEVEDLYNHAPCGYHSLDVDGNFVRINDTELAWLGYSRNEVIGRMKLRDLLTPASLETFKQTFPRFKAEGAVHDVEFEFVRKDGTTFPVLLSATAITDAAGDYVMSRSTVYDITERKRAERALRASEATLKKAQEVAHIGSWYLNIPQNQLTWSDEVFRIFGIEPGAALTYDAFIASVHPDDRNAVDAAWKAAMSGARYDIEHRIVAGNEVKWVHERAELEFDSNGNPQRGVGTVQDITARKATEAELLRAYRAQRALSLSNQMLVRATNEPELLQQICEIVVQQAGYRMCFVGRAESDLEKSILPVAQAGFEEGYLGLLNLTWADTERGRGPVGTCIRTRATVVVKNIMTDARMSPWRAEALKRGFASCVAIPLIVDTHVFGALAIYGSEPDAFTVAEVDLLSELASDLAFGIGTLRTRQERAQAEEAVRTLNAELEERVARRTAELHRAREREAEIGHRIQQTLLLDPPPTDVPGVEVAALSVPSQRIDGDFYIFIRHSNRALDVIVGDVMGKGVPAALLGAATKSHFLRALGDLMAVSKGGELPAPREVVMLAHAGVVRHLIELESFVTLCYLRLDLSRKLFELVDCGHTGILRLHGRTGRSEIVHGRNLPLGVREGEIYEQISAAFEPGDLLVLYSDGITEARNPEKELFGVERLQECIRSQAGKGPSDLIQSIREAVAVFSQSAALGDDLTTVAIRIGETELPLARRDIEIDSDLRHLHDLRVFVRDFCACVPETRQDPQAVSELELAVDEAASNIMKHAYHGLSDQWIYVEAEAFPGQIRIRLHHLGDSFDPAKVPAPALDGSRDSGFGVYIIGKSVDEVRYYRDDLGRNTVSIKKTIRTNGGESEQ